MLLLVATTLALFLWYLLRSAVNRVLYRLPPGPWTLPFTKNVPFMTGFAFRKYSQMQEKFGNIFGFYNGCLYTVVLSDFAIIKEAYNKDEFLYRPPSVFKLSDDYTHVGEMNGPDWKDMRRFTLTSLRNLGMGKNQIEEKIKIEISRDLNELRSESKKEVNSHEFFARALTNIVFSIVCGKDSEQGEALLPMFERYQKDLFSDIGDVFQTFHYPIIKYYYALVNMFITKEKMKGVTDMEEFMGNEISAHENRHDENLYEDFFDCFISEMKKHAGKQSPYTRPNMVGNALGLLFAGSHTTRISLDWVFLCLAEYPDVQKKAFEEIKNLLGTEKLPSWNDKNDLPYLNAFLMEVARCKTVAPAQDPHWSARTGTINGYHVPEGSMVIANIYAVHNDPKLWGDPENFRPERYLSPDGTKAVQPEYWIPFLIGKRMCPGEKLAVMQLFLITSAFIQNFKILPPVDGLSLEEKDGILLYPCKPVVTFQTRT